MSESLGKLFNIGCGDNSCTWGPRGGMATNGGCRCYDPPRYDEKDRGAAMKAYMLKKQGILLLRQLTELPSIQAALIELVKATKG